MSPERVEAAYLEALLVELEQPNEQDLLQMSSEADRLIEQEIDRLERTWPAHWRTS